jgi:tRNA (cytidine/uridine-2'-O-)-methyltransferase
VPDAPLLHLVLLHPEIPNNTGNIGRTAAALGCRLHIIHPIGFDMDDKARRRAGLDYWHLVDCVEHADWQAFLDSERPQRLWLFTARAERSLYHARFERGDYLLFGKESSGVDPETAAFVLAAFGEEALLRIPQPGTVGLQARQAVGTASDPATTSVRSLNLATAVAIAGYEGYRQISTREPS